MCIYINKLIIINELTSQINIALIVCTSYKYNNKDIVIVIINI